jgi:hypothetical protein
MNLDNYYYRTVLLLAISLLLSACGGGGGDSGGNAESLQAPYLISSPQVSSAPNATVPVEYDVTVTIRADGPAGIFSATVWLIDEIGTDTSVLYLTRIGGGNSWTGTTNTLIPVAAGTYKVGNIILNDADPDPFGASYRTGWYFEMPIFSTTHYYVDQRNIYSSPNFNLIANGVSSTPITRFTLP